MDMVSAETQPCAGRLQLPAVPTASVTPHKGNRRKETTSEERDRRGARAMTKGELREQQERTLLYSIPSPPPALQTISEETLNLVAQIDLKSCSSW